MKTLKMKSHKILIVILALSCFMHIILFPVHSGQDNAQAQTPINKKTLKNGLTLIYQKDASSAVTVVQVLIRGGQQVDPDDKQGLAYLTTRLVLEIPDDKKAQNMMSQASRIYMTCYGDYSIINITSLSENLDETLDITSHIILNPLFSGLRIDLIKKQMEYRKKAQEDDAILVGHYAVFEKFFAGLGYGGSVFGSEESLKAIKKKDIKGFYDSHFNAGNMIVASISDLEEEALCEIIEEHFTQLPSGEAVEAKPIAGSVPEEREISIEKDTQQYFISLSFLLPEVTTQNYTLAYLTEHLLGKGLNSRLWHLRSEEKLAYNVNARATQMRQAGILETYLETDKEKKEIALESLKRVLRTLYEGGITDEELEVTKTFSKASFLRDNETKTTRVQNLASFEALGLGSEFLDRFSEEIDAISLEEINAYIKQVLDPAKGVEVVVGPKK